ncbi:MAG TPA: MASE1 domain-containing protein [Patescibacteria group bacterium]|nr:MASE1 domain-containing protein [Patescibacteria group bacterium]
MGDKRLDYVIKFVILFTAYFASAKFGLSLNSVRHFATLVWAPTGIALASLFIFGYRFWPAITLAAFSINFITGASPLVALGIGIGNTLEPLLGAFLLKNFVRFDPKMERVRDVFGLVIVAAILCTTISATIGVSWLLIGGKISFSAFGTTWLAWWIGDMLGAIIVAPVLLVWSQNINLKFSLKRIAEMVGYLLALIAISGLVFRGYQTFGFKPFTLAYLIFPILIWSALRFGQLGSVTFNLVASAIAIWATISGSHSSGTTLSHQLILLQSFMGLTAVTFMTMAAVVAERVQTQQQEQILAEKAKYLTRQRARLIALNNAKDEFIALASHHLRTPATSVKQYTGMLLHNFAGKLTKQQREFLESAYNSNEKQLQVIDMLLRVALLDSGAIELKKEKVDLTLLINEVIESYSDSFNARQQQVKFNYDEPSNIALVDREKVWMVLENLIDNASKYSQPGKEIDINLKQNNKQLTIAIQDNGVGIVKKDTRKLFKKFSRIDNKLSSEVGGNGLGLYLSKKIISLHKGSISVRSNLKKGSTFTVTIPNSVN